MLVSRYLKWKLFYNVLEATRVISVPKRLFCAVLFGLRSGRDCTLTYLEVTEDTLYALFL